MYVIRIHEYAHKVPNQKTLKEYYGTQFIFFRNIDYKTIRGEVKLTPYIDKAKKFSTPVDAALQFKEIHPNFPVRPDGLPNRPITAFTIEVVKADELTEEIRKERNE
jgi:hypothetical protein